MLQSKDTRQLFVYLRPYMSKYIEAINKNSYAYAHAADLYQQIIKINKKNKN